MTKSRIGIDIEDESPRVDVHHQYGMRYPDGSIKWDTDMSGRTVNFNGLAQGSAVEARDWNHLLESRADSAKIDVHSYTAAHQLIKRSITVAVTAPEDI